MLLRQIAVAHHLGIEPAVIYKGLSEFRGVKRRFTYAGEWNGVEIFDGLWTSSSRSKSGTKSS